MKNLIPKNEFDSALLKRKHLSEQEKLVWEAQNWFNRMIEFYRKNIIPLIGGGTIIIPRAILICILNNPSTTVVEIVQRVESEVRMSDTTIRIEQYNIKAQWDRSYTLMVHDSWVLAAWVNYSDKATNRNDIMIIGPDEMQEEWKELANKIKRAWLLDNISMQWTKKRGREDILKILEGMDTKAVMDIELALANLNNNPKTQFIQS